MSNSGCNGSHYIPEEIFISILSRLPKHVVLPPTNILCLSYPEYVTYVAFGFHPGLNDYKVVRLLTFPEGNHCIEVEVYSLSTNSWKRIDAIPASLKTMVLHSDQFALYNGVAYCIMKKEDATYCFVSFDSEVFEEFLLPDAVESMLYNCKELIVEYKRSICLFQSNLDFRAGNNYIDVWVLQEKSFKKLLTVFLSGKRSFYPLAIILSNELSWDIIVVAICVLTILKPSRLRKLELSWRWIATTTIMRILMSKV